MALVQVVQSYNIELPLKTAKSSWTGATLALSNSAPEGEQFGALIGQGQRGPIHPTFLTKDPILLDYKPKR